MEILKVAVTRKMCFCFSTCIEIDFKIKISEAEILNYCAEIETALEPSLSSNSPTLSRIQILDTQVVFIFVLTTCCTVESSDRLTAPLPPPPPRTPRFGLATLSILPSRPDPA